MSQATKILRIIKLCAIEGWKVSVAYSNGEYRIIDFEQFFNKFNFAQDKLRAQLLDKITFQGLTLHEGTLRWPNVQDRIELSNGMVFEVPFDLDPLVLYENSELDSTKEQTIKIGAILRQARKDAGLTQMELARRSGTTKHYISRIENNHTDIEVGTLLKIVEIGLGKRLEVQVK
jgi:DNA-binding XRE family transcriptional regulator